MENSTLTWAGTTKTIYNGILLYAVAMLADAIITPIVSWGDKASDMFSFAATGSYNPGIGASDVIGFLLVVAMIAGYVLYLKGLGEFRQILSGGDAESIAKVRTAVILGIVGLVAAFIPFIGWLAALVLNIVSFVMMLQGFSKLRFSPTFPALARQGASSLYTAMIVSLVGAIVSIIPLVGGFFALVLSIIAFVMLFSGWGKIKNADPAVL